MYGLVSKVTNELVAIVERTDGYDLGAYDAFPVAGDPTAVAWDKATRSIVARAPTPDEETAAALASDPQWQALRHATPAQIDAWLAGNVTSLAQARGVLRFLLLAVQTLAKSRAR